MPPARRSRLGAVAPAIALATLAAAAACSADEPPPDPAAVVQTTAAVDELPRMLNAELPFRYPPALYAQKTQANVLLRLYIDSTGAVASDSTAVVETSGSAPLDSAARAGAAELVFAPARRRGVAVGTTVLLPVHFRHPDAPPLPGDSAILPQPSPTPSGSGSTGR